MLDPTELQARLNRIRESVGDLRTAIRDKDQRWQRQLHHIIMLEVSMFFDEIQFQVEKDREACRREGLSSEEAKSSPKLQLLESPDAGPAA